MGKIGNLLLMILGVPLIALIITVIVWYFLVITGLAWIVINNLGFSWENYNYFFLGVFVVICVALWILLSIADVAEHSTKKKQELGDSVLSPLQSEDEEIAQKLAQLSKLLDTQNTSDKAAAEKMVAEIRSIGEQLCANGGNKRMKLIAMRTNYLAYNMWLPTLEWNVRHTASQIHTYSAALDMYWERSVQKYWDGICSWKALPLKGKNFG